MSAPSMPPTVAEIQRQVAASFGVRREHILCRDRCPSYVRPRHAAMYIARSLTHHSMTRLAHFFERADHTTILHGVQTTQKRIAEDRDFARKIDTIFFCLSPLSTRTAPLRHPVADVELAA